MIIWKSWNNRLSQKFMPKAQISYRQKHNRTTTRAVNNIKLNAWGNFNLSSNFVSPQAKISQKPNLSFSPDQMQKVENQRKQWFSPPAAAPRFKPESMLLPEDEQQLNVRKSIDSKNKYPLVPWHKLINYDQVLDDKINNYEKSFNQKQEMLRMLNFQVKQKHRQQEMEDSMSRYQDNMQLAKNLTEGQERTQKVLTRETSKNHDHQMYLINQI